MPTKSKTKQAEKTETATFAAGCFWGVEAAFQQVNGVVSTAVGYTGGKMKSPTYKDVCSDKTGHAEAVLVEFDPNKITYEGLLEIFWKMHDPTTYNRQGPDVGSQYRSAIFYHNAEQKAAALKSRQNAQKNFAKPIATEIVPAKEFYPAEEYHQNYYKKHGKTCKIDL